MLLFDGKACIKFSDVWNVVRSKRNPLAWARWLWSSKAPRWTIINGWQCFHHGLLTHDALQKRGVYVISRCLLCLSACECVDHLLFECPFSRKIWYDVGLNFIQSWTDVVLVDTPKLKVTILLVFRELWKERNYRLFEENFRSSPLIVHEIFSILNVVM